MFEVNKEYRTANGLEAHILSQVNNDGTIWLIGYVAEPDTIEPQKWLRSNGKSSLASSSHDLVHPNVTLDLNWEEAVVLRTLLHRHVTGPFDGPRKHTDSISEKLVEAGVSSCNLLDITTVEDARFHLNDPNR